MTVQKEIEQPTVEQSHQPAEVVEIPSAPEIPEHIERAGVSSSQPDPTAVTDDSGQTLIHPANDDPSAGPIVLPVDPATIDEWAKGSVTEARKWLGVLLNRMKLKAWSVGRKVVYSSKSN